MLKSQKNSRYASLSSKIIFRGKLMTYFSMLETLFSEGWVLECRAVAKLGRRPKKSETEYQKRRKEAGHKLIYYVCSPDLAKYSFWLTLEEASYFASLNSTTLPKPSFIEDL